MGTQPPIPPLLPSPVTSVTPIPPDAVPIRTQAEIEYRDLSNYFKYLISITGTVLGILVAAAGILFYTNLRDARKDAVDSATNEAHKAVAAALEVPAMQKIIDEEVSKQTALKVDDAIRNTLAKRMQQFEDEQRQIIDTAILVSIVETPSGYGGVVGGTPEQFHKLIDRLRSPYPRVTSLARDSLRSIASQIRQDVTGANHSFFATNARGYMTNAPDARGIFEQLCSRETLTLVLFKNFSDMHKLTGWNVEDFDVQAAKEWCASHDCKMNTPTE
jgi:hypothetical protein